MTDMKRITISIPPEMDKKILEMRKDDKFIRSSYSEIVRTLVFAGLDISKREKNEEVQ